ncbi:MAG: glycoside hydrolase family 38 C-terminal domain-containing protein [Candidatus Melainabacteria bacterium]|nr:glycoside hydrolase family 38 C-terminal domain-containing protein [Candidatus Melainabacteria bacterium]
MATNYSFYLHTHWDREWYYTYEQYRMQLPGVIGGIIKQIESGALPSFQLDGQTVLLEDLLEIQPQLKSKIEALVKSGKVVVGPWYVLCDHMLVSGESLIRNLKTGLSVAREFGKPMMVGYSPDTFGHSQDIPRILRGFSIDKAIAWRGVPKSIASDTTEFIWESPDGSTVFCHILSRGYFQVFFHEAKDPTNPITKTLSTWPLSKINDSGLIPVGGDHVGAPPSFNHQLQMLKDAFQESSLDPQNQPTLEVVTLGSYLTRLQNLQENHKQQIPIWEGELRHNDYAKELAAAYLLQGVLSSRLYLKRLNRQVEHRLFKIVEPLCTFASSLNLSKYPFEELLYALKQLLKNQPHDSICGCSVDSVHQEMLTRYQTINSILDNLETRVRESLLLSSQVSKSAIVQGLSRAHFQMADPKAQVKDFLLFNFSSRPVLGPVAFEMAFEDQSMSVESATEAVLAAIGADKEKSLQIDETVACTELFGFSGGVPTYRDISRVRGWLYAETPALGCANFSEVAKPASALSKSTDSSIANEFMTLHFDQKGNLSVDAGKKKFDLTMNFKDVGDGGDSYNFDPVYQDEAIEAKFVKASVKSRGSLVCSIELVHEIDIPKGLEQSKDQSPLDGVQTKDILKVFKRASETLKHELRTVMTLKSGVPVLFCETTFINQSRDHRLEVEFKTSQKIDATYAENHFSLVERKVTLNSRSAKDTPALPVGKYQEAPLDRFACQRFFIAGDQLFLNRGLPEYGATENSVSITLLRAFSKLSRPGLFSRGGGAGPHMDTPEGNCLFEQTVSYGFAPLVSGEPNEAYHLATLFENPLWASPVCQKGWKPKLPPSKQESWSFCQIGNENLVLMAMFEDSQGYNLRLLNTSKEAVTANLNVGINHRYLEEVDLDGYRFGLINATKPGVYEVDFRAHELKSFRLNLKSQG